MASDPNQGLQFVNGDLLYLPISEQPLDWDQRHTLSASLVIRDPGKWGFRLLWTYGSGFPSRRPSATTASRIRARQLAPAAVESTLSIDGDKFYKVWGQNVTVLRRRPQRARLEEHLRAQLERLPQPVREPGRATTTSSTSRRRDGPGGAYLQDTNGDGRDDWVPVQDPRVWAEGRNVRVGVGVSF